MKQVQNIHSVRCSYSLSLVRFSVSFFRIKKSDKLSMCGYSFSIHLALSSKTPIYCYIALVLVRTEWFHNFLENWVLLTSQLFQGHSVKFVKAQFFHQDNKRTYQCCINSNNDIYCSTGKALKQILQVKGLLINTLLLLS